ncbi:CDP-alcohol phosphatidyltransferase family protein [Brevundimonas sp. 2R-24]|uniref:CDP-alcohol phosphatidyltransferase family protein n=1 Tax=Peiella sedimenti TaxID=3061083 RepID=A0ABT8SL50_9CAUL|nr:CDP-alcohol phosphatidyltransferase family protein [Caulobacteraceae bacterium XZ-24]
MQDLEHRRPVKARGLPAISHTAFTLARLGVSANAVSAASVVLAALGGWALAQSGEAAGGARILWLVLALIGVNGRLLCNVLDGLIAVEQARGSPTGPIWNELPDRLADALLLVGAGYGAAVLAPQWGPALGWLAALLAVLTAYVRELGRSLSGQTDFAGPAAKPLRMGLLNIAIAGALIEPLAGFKGHALMLGLMVIAALTALTVANRTRRLAERLSQ